jgi:BirA family biotin operon repressor/biotin-[acetyl-CoA-carboxylase] ligase
LTEPAPSALADAPTAETLWLAEVDSTNAEARRRAEAGETGPLWIAARRQTAGRGRRGRAWEGDARNLATTLLTVTHKPPAEAAQVAFVAALAAADLALDSAPEALVRLKWPNDLMLGGQKAAGVLIESGARADGRLWLAVGVGVNLAAAPSDLERPASAFADHLKAGVARPPSPERALDTLARAFDHWWSVWTTDGFAPIRTAWTARADLGRPCLAHLGSDAVEGVAEALEADGALRLRLVDGGVRRITAGDVFPVERNR